MLAWITTWLALGSLLALPVGGLDMVPWSEPLTARGFERLFEEDGVTVYRHRRSEVVRLGAEGRFGVPPAELRRVLLAYERHEAGVERVVESRILDRGGNWLLVYQRLDLPLLDDRDHVLFVTWGADDDGALWTRFRAVNDQGPPPREDAVRLTHHRGSWQLRSIEGGRATRARYQVSLDLGGLVPSWLARTSAGDEVPALFADLCRLLGRPVSAAGVCPADAAPGAD